MSQTNEEFNDRWGIILASLGMAIGAGNLWRFPRLAGQYGGSFILLWIVFLVIWSIPLLLAEFSIGKKFKKGVIGSFGSITGKKFAWMGFFITICTLGIAFYYSVVTAWSIEYLFISFSNLIDGLSGNHLGDKLSSNPQFLIEQWDRLSNENLYTVIIYIIVILIGVFVISRGVNKGLEKANKILIPTLFVLLVIVAIAALSMEGGIRGLDYMFSVRWENFQKPIIWIEALSQSAWSTGAGWGLMITISSYTRKNEDVTLNTFVGAFGNNTASILAGMAILPAVFAMSATDGEAISFLQSGSQSLTFIIVPELFSTVPGGQVMTVVFFLALTLAAFSSFLPMLELLKTNLLAFNLRHKTMVIILMFVFIIFGFPSAYSLDYFSNQDWVWGLGLIVSGIFIAFATAYYGVDKFKRELIDNDSDLVVSSALFKIFIYINIALGLVLIYWWMSQGYSEYPWLDASNRWNWYDVYSNASITTQWGLVIIIGIFVNNYLYKKYCKTK